jgi:hypothetical protein
MLESFSKLMALSKKRMNDDVFQQIIMKSDLFFPKDGERTVGPFTLRMNNTIVKWISDVAAESSLQVDSAKPLTNALVGVLYCTMELFYDVLLHFKGIVDLGVAQCIVATCFMIAAKSVWGAEKLIKDGNLINTMSYLSSGSCSKTQIRKMEPAVLDIVDWKVCKKTQPYIAKFGQKEMKTRSHPNKPKRSRGRSSKKVRSAP